MYRQFVKDVARELSSEISQHNRLFFENHQNQADIMIITRTTPSLLIPLKPFSAEEIQGIRSKESLRILEERVVYESIRTSVTTIEGSQIEGLYFRNRYHDFKTAHLVLDQDVKAPAAFRIERRPGGLQPMIIGLHTLVEGDLSRVLPYIRAINLLHDVSILKDPYYNFILLKDDSPAPDSTSPFSNLASAQTSEDMLPWSLFDRPLGAVGIQSSTIRALRAYGIENVGELVGSRQEELKFHDREDHLTHINRCLAERGLQLSMPIPKRPVPPDASESLDIEIKQLQFSKWDKEIKAALTQHPGEQDSSFRYVGHLVSQTRRQLLDINGLGGARICIIKQALRDLTLSLGMDVGDWQPPPAP